MFSSAFSFVNRPFVRVLMRIGIATLLLLVLRLSGLLDLNKLLRVPVFLFMAPLPFYIFGFFAAIYRWRCLLRAAGIPISTWDITRLTLTGIWVSSVIPGGSIFAGDAARTALFAVENSTGRMIALVSVFLDRVLGMLAIFVIAAAALFLDVSMLRKNLWLQMIGIILVSLIAVFFGIALATLSRTVYNFLTTVRAVKKVPGHQLFLKVLEAFHLFQNHWGGMLKAHFVSYLGHGSMIFAILILAQGIGIQLNSFSEYLFAISVGIISAMIPVSGPAGVGAGNVGFAASFALVSSNYGAELALLWQATFILASQVGLPFFLLGRRRVKLSSA